jgi:hypothetical protein
MTRPTLKELASKLNIAASFITHGECYRHQSSGKVYEVVGHAISEATNEPLVLYRAASFNKQQPLDPDCIFARPVVEFLEVVEWHDGEMLRTGTRFKRVIKTEHWKDTDG